MCAVWLHVAGTRGTSEEVPSMSNVARQMEGSDGGGPQKMKHKRSLTLTKFWKVRCLEMDIQDYLESGDVTFLRYGLSDLPLIEKALKAELKERKQSVVKKK